jgi:purine nucleosidase
MTSANACGPSARSQSGWSGGFRYFLILLLAGVSTLSAQQDRTGVDEFGDSARIAMLQPPAKKPVAVVFDTDTYNEIDDQFALVCSLISPELRIEAVYAAPFKNSRSTSAEDGMEKSHEEFLRVLGKMGMSEKGLVHKGSRQVDPW